MSLTQTAIEILSNLYGQSVASGSFSADSPHTHTKGKTITPPIRGRAKEEKRLGPIDIELKRQAKAALGRLHRRISRKMKDSGQSGDGKTMRVTKKNHKSRLGHDWYQDPNGSHVYQHHSNSNEAILQKIKRLKESLRALTITEETPAYGHEGRAARDAKIAFAARRLEKRAMNKPTLPSWGSGKPIKQSYREGSIAKVGRDLKPNQAIPVRMTARGMIGKHTGSGEPDAWVHNHPENGVVLSREKPETAKVMVAKPKTKIRKRQQNRQPNRLIAALRGLVGSSTSPSTYGANKIKSESYQNTPSNREIGTDSLTDTYASETPGQGGKCKKCRCKKCICKHIREIKEAKKKSRCWKGYKPTPGKKPYSKDSCQPIEEVKKEYQSAAGGLNAKGREYFKRTEGANLQAPVTGKVKPGSKAAKRRKSFCARSRGWTGERGKAARRRWKC